MPVSASHQTVRLTRGRHENPDSGVCVMELASMLAGEPFSDRPQCVCRVIAAVMRACNDRFSHRDRQRLYAYAASAVGTRGGDDLERRRLTACTVAVNRRRSARRWLRGSEPTLPPNTSDLELERFADRVVRGLRRYNGYPVDDLLALLDELLAIREGDAEPPDEVASVCVAARG